MVSKQACKLHTKVSLATLIFHVAKEHSDQHSPTVRRLYSRNGFVNLISQMLEYWEQFHFPFTFTFDKFVLLTTENDFFHFYYPSRNYFNIDVVSRYVHALWL